VKTRRIVALAVVAPLLLVGCRNRLTSQDYQDRLCNAVASLDGSVAELASLQPTTANVARVKALRVKMEAQYKQVQASAKKAGGVGIDAVTRAYNDVLSSINGVNDESSFAQAEPRIDQVAGEFSDARLQLHDQAGC
jgi:outer membrane murein-binding lipoprotein Lpp